MAKTKADIVAKALRIIRVISDDDDPTPDMQAYVGDTLEAVFEELRITHRLFFTWGLDETPTGVFVPMAQLVAADVAAHYNKQPPSRARAIGRICAFVRSDDRRDPRDTDNDGTVTQAEEEAAGRAEYF